MKETTTPLQGRRPLVEIRPLERTYEVWLHWDQPCAEAVTFAATREQLLWLKNEITRLLEEG